MAKLRKTILFTSLLFLFVFSTGLVGSFATGPTLTFSTPQDLSCTTSPCPKGSAVNPSLWVNGAYVFVTWEQKISKNFHAMVAVSNNGGVSFGAPIDLSAMNSITNKTNAHLTQITASGSDVYVTWADSTDRQIWVATSTSNGAAGSWKLTLIDPTQNTAVSPVIASTGSYVYVVWTLNGSSRGAEFSMSSNNGATFSAPLNIALYNGVVQGKATEAAIAIAGNNVYVVWDSIYFRASNNNGLTWPNPPKLLLSGGREPQIAASGNNVYVAWTQNSTSTNKRYQIYFDVNTNAGNPSNWLPAGPQILTRGNGKAEEPQVTAAGSDVYIMYRDNVNRNTAPASEGIFFLYNTNNGVAGNWKNSTTVDTTYMCGSKICGDLSETLNNTSWGHMSTPASAPGIVDLVWTVQCGKACGPLPSGQSPSASAWNIVVAASTDDGQTFSMAVVHADNGQQGPIPAANAPPVFASSSEVYVAYQDNSTQYSSNQNAHIIFSESPT
jgi:hypothetical protein